MLYGEHNWTQIPDLRKKVAELKGVEVFFPDSLHCMDNAAMIAHLAWLRYSGGSQADFSTEVLARWPVETVSSCSTPNGQVPQ